MPNAYDQVPYPSLSYVQCHPDRLATVAALLGMNPVPIERCRVLELGCAGGWNLIGMAYTLPQSEFVGIDYSSRQIRDGQAHLQALGLGNVTLKHMDILDADGDLGQFDYIVAHGVFSWVPRSVQDQLLRVCRQSLAPNGVAYVSYNTYPGWHMLAIVRDMMLYHARNAKDPQERVASARACLDFLADAVSPDSPYGSFLNSYTAYLRGEVKGANAAGDSFLYHDELEEVNEPIYFAQFAERAAEHGLQYLGETDLRTMVDTNFPPEVSARLREMATSIIDLEQYMDFLRNQTFRKTLLCHQEVALSRTLTPERVKPLFVAARTRVAEPEPDVYAAQVVQFQAPDGAVLSTDHPLTKAAMLHLADIWPGSIAVEDLMAAARARLAKWMPEAQASDPSEVETAVLCTNLLKAHVYSSNLVELRTFQPPLTLEPGECPLASPVARLQAQSWSTVTNLRHERVELDELNRYLLPRLDGAHDHTALIDDLEAGPVAEGLLTLREEDERVEGTARVRELLSDSVEQRVAWLARSGLLIG